MLHSLLRALHPLLNDVDMILFARNFLDELTEIGRCGFPGARIFLATSIID